jgi:hypothetical protein
MKNSIYLLWFLLIYNTGNLDFKIDMKKPTLFLLVFVAFIMLISCKKTEKTLNKIYGHYTLKTYNVDGVDSLDLYNTQLGDQFYFYNDKNDNFNHLVIYKTTLWDTTGEISFLWTLNKKNDIIEIKQDNYIVHYGILPFKYKITSEWEIVKLEENKFDINTNCNGKNYLVELLKN